MKGRNIFFKFASILGITLVCAGLFLAMRAGASTQRGRNPDSLRGSESLALGQALFNDKRLSANRTLSCASCHIPSRDFADGRRVSVGVHGLSGTRNAPSLATLGRSGGTSFFWDGRRNRLEEAVLDPFTNPVEMGLVDDNALLQAVREIPAYGRQLPPIDATNTIPARAELKKIAESLALYVRSNDRRKSAYDRYFSDHDSAALDDDALHGLAIFNGKGRCAQCHQLTGVPTAFTDHAFHHSGVGLEGVEQRLPQLTQEIIARSLRGEALGKRIATHPDEAQLGRFNFTLQVADIGLFRTPSLRRVSLTSPYMHDGSVVTLGEAVDREVYYRGLTSGHPIGLSVNERKQLLAFLRSL